MRQGCAPCRRLTVPGATDNEGALWDGAGGGPHDHPPVSSFEGGCPRQSRPLGTGGGCGARSAIGLGGLPPSSRHAWLATTVSGVANLRRCRASSRSGLCPTLGDASLPSARPRVAALAHIRILRDARRSSRSGIPQPDGARMAASGGRADRGMSGCSVAACNDGYRLIAAAWSGALSQHASGSDSNPLERVHLLCHSGHAAQRRDILAACTRSQRAAAGVPSRVLGRYKDV